MHRGSFNVKEKTLINVRAFCKQHGTGSVQIFMLAQETTFGLFAPSSQTPINTSGVNCFGSKRCITLSQKCLLHRL